MGVPTSLGLYADAVDGHGAELRTRGNLDPSTGLYGMRLAHGWGHGEARPRGGDVAGTRHRGYTCLFFDAPGAAEAERRLAGLLRELASELAAGNRVGSHEPVPRGEGREARRQGRGHRGGHGPRGVLCAVPRRGHGTLRGACHLP